MMITKYGCHRLILGLFCSTLFGMLSACDDEQIAQLDPRIFVCATQSSPANECNQTFDVGEVPLSAGKNVELHIVSRGNATLTVKNLTSDDGISSALDLPVSISVGASKELGLHITAPALGPQRVRFSLENDDPARTSLVIELQLVGVPSPVPEIQFCREASGVDCGPDLVVDFGAVRRTQQDSITFYVKNAGTATLAISEVRIEGMPSADGEFTLVTSTRPGKIDVGVSVPVVVVYEPLDGVDDEMDIVFRSNDPDHAEAVVLILGASEDNKPPSADAREQVSGGTNLDVFVEDLIVLDGSASSDPEGDPLVFEWTLLAPARSQSGLDDSTAGVVAFTPDVAGSYRVELRTYDSINQASEVASVVLINARPKFKLRITADWTQGGDVDLHLLDQNGALFGPKDCYFLNRTPDFGQLNNSEDDPILRNDATSSPGREELVFILPADGTYQLYLHYFDDDGSGAAEVNVEVIFNDSSLASHSGTVTLNASCDLWFLGEITFPNPMFGGMSRQLAPICR